MEKASAARKRQARQIAADARHAERALQKERKKMKKTFRRAKAEAKGRNTAVLAAQLLSLAAGAAATCAILWKKKEEDRKAGTPKGEE
jgi:mevalonate pyrophosphate decarboxylase